MLAWSSLPFAISRYSALRRRTGFPGSRSVAAYGQNQSQTRNLCKREAVAIACSALKTKRCKHLLLRKTNSCNCKQLGRKEHLRRHTQNEIQGSGLCVAAAFVLTEVLHSGGKDLCKLMSQRLQCFSRLGSSLCLFWRCSTRDDIFIDSGETLGRR